MTEFSERFPSCHCLNYQSCNDIEKMIPWRMVKKNTMEQYENWQKPGYANITNHLFELKNNLIIYELLLSSINQLQNARYM